MANDKKKATKKIVDKKEKKEKKTPQGKALGKQKKAAGKIATKAKSPAAKKIAKARKEGIIPPAPVEKTPEGALIEAIIKAEDKAPLVETPDPGTGSISPPYIGKRSEKKDKTGLWAILALILLASGLYMCNKPATVELEPDVAEEAIVETVE